MADANTVVNVASSPAPQGNIAKALAVFQAKLPVITKDSTADTGKFSYDYAGLDAISPVILPLLAAQGIVYTAVPDWTEQGFGLRAALIHESGEKIEGFYPLGSPNNPAQAIGSAITYARRYALLSLTGVAPVGSDDDGKSASGAQGEAVAKATASTAAPKEDAQSVRTEMGNTIETSGGLLTTDDANTVMNEVTNGKGIEDWTLADMKKGRTALNKLLESRKATAEAK